MPEDRLCCIETNGQRWPACMFLWSHLNELNLKLQFVLCSFSFRCSLMKIHNLMSCFLSIMYILVKLFLSILSIENSGLPSQK